MRRPLFNIIVLTLIGVLAIWLSGRPGDLVLRWPGYELRTSVAVGLSLLGAAIFMFLLTWRSCEWLVNWPARLRTARRKQKRQRGEAALAGSMMALSEGNLAEAHRAAAEAQHNLPDHALPLLLSAQTARLSGDMEAAAGHYQSLMALPAGVSKSDSAKELGLRGLFSIALAEGKQEEARGHLENMLALGKPKNRPVWALQGLFHLEAAAGNWQEAGKLMDQLVRKGGMDKPTARRLRAVLLVGEGQELAARLSQTENAEARERGRELVQRAIQLAPDFVPGLVLAATLCAGGTSGQVNKIARRMEQLWARTPHPDLAAAYLALRPGKSALQKLKLVQKLTAKNREHAESRLALADAAIKARRWSMARIALKDDQESPSRRVCRLMADLEAGENEDAGLAREWLDRALKAPPDPCWVSPAGEAAEWRAVCPETGLIDAYSWGLPGQSGKAVAVLST